MLVSEFIIDFLSKNGVDTVFGITGTAVNMLFVSAERKKGMRYVCPLHEQAASMAADGYSRVTGKIGVCIATSGPGVTNLITGVAGAYTESIPMLVIVGQASTQIQKKSAKIRYYGFQEFDTISTYKPYTKYASEVTDPSKVGYEMEKAISIATSGRKGPVVLSFPEDVLYAEAVTDYGHYYAPVDQECLLADSCHSILSMLQEAQRPVLLLGGGIHCAGAEKESVFLIEKIGCPVLLTYPARDLLADNHACNAGSIGIFGSRSGNYALCNADLILGIGCRFDSYAIGEAEWFAKDAKVIAVDIDRTEQEKYQEFGIKNTLSICADAGAFISAFVRHIVEAGYNSENNSAWRDTINRLKSKYPLCEEAYKDEETTNPYYLVERLSNMLPDGTRIFVDTGLSSTWLGQAYKFKKHQRMMSQFGFSAMGYSLPAAIGACFADPDQRILCFMGDGSLQMNIQELATAVHYRLNLAIIVVCNNGYGLIQKTQDDFNNGHAATDPDHGVGLPDIAKVASAYGLDVLEIYTNEQIDSVFDLLLNSTDTSICLAHIDIKKRITPRKRGKGSLADLFPPIDLDI